jgi:mannose-6-phosphate isomerase
MLYPLTFEPIFKQRVWGGRTLEQLYGKSLPPAVPIGESWEISDRPGDVNVVANGPLAGRDLHWLMEHEREGLMGNTLAESGRFPLLIKLLDAREKLSLQVHPPAEKARQLGGEPKTEMWYIAQAEPGAELFVGLRRGVTRNEFEQRLNAGTVSDCFHRVPVRTGDAMFLPSGRVHAIGEGLVIFEIQQNSDTTYRVFDWNRAGLDGQPRELHISQSLASIDFNDFEPSLVPREIIDNGPAQVRVLARDTLFSVELVRLAARKRLALTKNRLQIIGVTEGEVVLDNPTTKLQLRPGRFGLIPAVSGQTEVEATSDSAFLRVEPGGLFRPCH